MADTLEEIRQLSVAERIQLVEEIWDSIRPEDIDVTEAQRAELEARFSAHEQNPISVSPWKDVRERILSRENL